MKNNIIKEITNKLSEYAIEYKEGVETDLSINKEFLDAKWSTGDKKIKYESNILINDQEKTIYMYEKTTEIGKGISLGGGVDSSFQSGTTLYRKVKSVQYGPEGKAYDIELDLGAIPKAVKEIAKKYDYKFKTVIMKKKAMYPIGSAAGKSVASSVVSNVEGDSIKNSKVVEKFDINSIPKGSMIGLGILGIVVALLYILMEVTIIGWILALVSFGLLFYYFYSHPLLKGIFSVVILVVSLIVLFIVGALSSNMETNSVSDKNGNQVVEKADEDTEETAVDNSKTVVGITLAKPANWDLVGENGKVLYSYRKSDLSTVVVMGLTSVDQEFYKLKEISKDDIVGTTVAKVSGFEKIKIGDWNAVKILGDDTAGTGGGYVYIYYIDLPGYTDVSIMAYGRTLEEAKTVASEWEGFLPGLQLEFQ